MNYHELKKLFCDHESGKPKTHLTAYITFSSFNPTETRNFTWESRTYIVSSDNKAFRPSMGGYSIFGSCLDGTDRGIRLENYIAEERGGKDGWGVEDCGILSYLLLENSDYGITTPKLYYDLEQAQAGMLSKLAGFVYADPAELVRRYRMNGCRIATTDYHAEKFKAYASTIKESGAWEIQPVYISGPLNITIGTPLHQ